MLDGDLRQIDLSYRPQTSATYFKIVVGFPDIPVCFPELRIFEVAVNRAVCY